MNRDVYHTILFQEQQNVPLRSQRTTPLSRLPFLNFRQNSRQLTGKNALYALENAIGRVYQVLRYIEYSGQYIDKYAPIIKEMPTMYKLMKAFNEIESNANNKEDTQKENIYSKEKVSTPKLYI